MSASPPPDTFVWQDPLDPPKAYVQVIRNAWWVVDGDGWIALYRSKSGSLHPQCNMDPRIAEGLVDSVPGAVGVKRIPLALAPIRWEDYR